MCTAFMSGREQYYSCFIKIIWMFSFPCSRILLYYCDAFFFENLAKIHVKSCGFIILWINWFLDINQFKISILNGTYFG